MYFNKKNSVYKSSLIQTLHGFGTKQSGDGRDVDVIKKILCNENSDYKSIIIPSQTHSTNVAAIVCPLREQICKLQNTDAVVTNQKGIVLTVVTADCVPIIYYDKKAGVIGISHGGWKGTLEKISLRVIEKMIGLGSEKENILIAIGPAIGSCCYRIYGERLIRFQNEFGDTVILQRNNDTYLNLNRINYLSLSENGIPKENIELSNLCTSCFDIEFFSYMRDSGINGEMISYILLQ